MTLQRLDNIGIVVEDMAAAIAFFMALGMEEEGRAEVEGPWVDATLGLRGVRSAITMMRTPDGRGRLELATYLTPAAIGATPENPPPNTVGLHRVMFTVQDIDATLDALRPHGAEVLGEVAQYADMYRLCYLRGPSGIIVALAQELGPATSADDRG